LKKLSFVLSFLLTILFAVSTLAQRARDDGYGGKLRAQATAEYSGTERPRMAAEPASGIAVPRSLMAIERRTFDLINNERERRGLSSLEWSDDAARLARLHSRNMAQQHFFSHRGLDGLMVDGRAEQMGLFNWRAIGENIAFNRGYDDPIGLTIEKWLESPSHKSNMLNREWVESGIGVAIGSDGSYYFTQVFLLVK
jgi:uncharacterized protein YkwD